MSYAELLMELGHRFSRPKMRALCRTLDAIDDADEIMSLARDWGITTAFAHVRTIIRGCILGHNRVPNIDRRAIVNDNAAPFAPRRRTSRVVTVDRAVDQVERTSGVTINAATLGCCRVVANHDRIERQVSGHAYPAAPAVRSVSDRDAPQRKALGVIEGAHDPLIPAWIARVVEAEPLEAGSPQSIDGGADGMGVVRECLAAIGSHLGSGGVALLQLGPGDQVEAVGGMLADTKLVPGETREFGERGVLLRIDHRG